MVRELLADERETVPAPAPVLVSDPFELRHLYEVVDGNRVERRPTSTNAELIATELVWHVGTYARTHNSGQACSEVLFRLPLPVHRKRRPDVAFVPYTVWPKGRPWPGENGWTALPSLCVEVVSPTDEAEDAREKVEEYLRAGVAVVWVVYPRLQVVDVYEPPDRLRVLRRADELDGGAALPGFRLRLADLFPEPPADPPAAAE